MKDIFKKYYNGKYGEGPDHQLVENKVAEAEEISKDKNQKYYLIPKKPSFAKQVDENRYFKVFLKSDDYNKVNKYADEREQRYKDAL